MYVYFRLDAPFTVMSVCLYFYDIIVKSLEKNYIKRTSTALFSYAVSDLDAGNGMNDDE